MVREYPQQDWLPPSPQGVRTRRRPTPEDLRKLHAGEAELLINQIRYTAAALDLARAKLANQRGIWGSAGGHPRRHAALRVLARGTWGATVSSLARDMHCSRQAAHRLARGLLEAHLIDVECHASDRRTLMFTVSAAGRRALNEAEDSARACIGAITILMGAHEMRALSRQLRRIREAAAELRERGGP